RNYSRAVQFPLARSDGRRAIQRKRGARALLPCSGKEGPTMLRTFACAAALALLAAPAAWAEDHSGRAGHAQGSATTTDAGRPGSNQAVPDSPAGKTVLLDDQAFVPQALEGSMAEVQLADLALEKSKNDSVRS